MPHLSPHMKIKKGRPLDNWPGGNTPPTVSIDSFTASPVVNVPDSGFTGSAADTEQGDLTAQIDWIIRTVIDAAGYADADNGGAGSDVTALGAGTYYFDVTLEVGGLQQLSITTSGGEDYDAIAALMNTAVSGGSVAFVGTAFRVTSDDVSSTGSAVVAIGTGGTDLFGAIDAADTVTTTFPTPVAGTDETFASGGTGGAPTLTFPTLGVQDVTASITDGFAVTVTDIQSVTVTT